MSRKTRKLIWSAPLLAVFAVAAALAIFAAQAPDPAQAHGAPGPATGLTATADGRYAIDLSWTAPTTGTVTGYRIDTSTDAFVWKLLMADTGSTDTSYKVEDLDAASTHYFRVYALSGDHTGPVSINPIYAVATTGNPVAPSAVTGLTATRDLEEEIKLTWNQPSDPGGADVARYCIVARGVQAGAAFVDLAAANCAAGLDATSAADIGTNIATPLNTSPVQGDVANPIVVTASSVEADDGTASWTLEGLNDDVVAQFRVVAVNTPGLSVASNIAEGRTAPAGPEDLPTAPGMPSNLKLVGADGATNDNTVHLYWSEPAGLNGTTTAQVQRQVFTPGTGWAPQSSSGDWQDPGVAANLFAGAGTLANHAQFVDDNTSTTGVGTPATTIDVGAGKVRYRVRYTDSSSNLSSGWAYSAELEFPFPQNPSDPTANSVNLPVISVADGTNTDRLRVVDDFEYFQRIDLAWARQSFCTDAGDTDCDTTSMTSTYAIDVSAEDSNGDTDGNPTPTGAEGLKWDRLTGTISFSNPIYRHHTSALDDGTKLVSDETRHYRVFPWHAGRYGYPAVVTGNTKLASVPNRVAPGGLRVTADGETKLMLDWDVPSYDGGSPVTHYLIQVNTDRDNDSGLLGNDTAANWCDVAFQKAEDGRMYTYTGKIASTAKADTAATAVCSGDAAPLTATGEELKAGYARWFRVIPLNKKSNTPPATVANGWTVLGTSTLAPLGAGELHEDSVNTAIAVIGRTAGAAPPAADAAPGAPIGLVAETALNVHSQLTTQKGVLLTWDEPASGGTAAITDYVIERAIDGGDWTVLRDGVRAGSTDWTDPRLPTATEQFVYRVAAVNTHGTSPWSNMAYYSTSSMVAPTHRHVMAVTPNPLMVETLEAGSMATVDAEAGFTPDPADAMVSYAAESDDDTVATASVDGSMVTIEAKAAGTATITVTATAIHDTATQSIMVTVIDVPGMPTASAMADDTDNRTQINVSWTAPADNGSSITSYIIERRYTGDMMGDITASGYNANVNGASFAFSNHMEWWETLNCKGMLQAAGSDEDPAGSGPDKMMYCAHYADTAPTNMAGTIMAGDATDMAIKALFDKRYVLIDDATTMMHADMGLMPGTEYTYRVSAVNSVGRSKWSAPASAMTTANMAPSGDALTAEVMEGMTVKVQSTITDPESDALTWSSDAASSDATKATATVDDMGMVTISGHAAGMADITVTATDSFGAEGTQTITVTVASGALGKPTNVMAMLDPQDPGLNDIVVTWEDGANADVHHVYLVPTDFNFANIRNERVTSGGTYTFMDVAPDTYIVAVQSTSPTTEGYEYAIAPALITVGGQ